MGDGIERRDFLKIVGASGAGAGMLGCSTEEVEKLIPYVVPQEEIVPGVATWYATVCGECPAGCGMWVRTREGRAVKVEGNPNHPVSGGSLCARGQASLQGLYDPDRVKAPLLREEDSFREASWSEAEELLAGRIRDAGGPVHFVTGETGRSLGLLVDEWLAGIGGIRVEHRSLSEAPLREATRIAFGRAVVPTYRLEDAGYILSFGADFLETWLSPVEHGRGFGAAAGVDEAGHKARFVFLGPRLSLTGQNADEWIPLAPGDEAAVALAMAHVIAGDGGEAGPFAPVVEQYAPEDVARQAGIEVERIEEVARRFHRESSVALGPGVAGQHRHATASNVAVLILNAVAGNVGSTLRVGVPDLAAPAAPYAELEAAARRIAGGGSGPLLLRGVNPLHTLPADAGFREAFEAAPFTVVFSPYMDETAAAADLVLPEPHFLETWGDSRPRPDVHALQQPSMQPVPHFDSKHPGDVLIALASRLGTGPDAGSFYDYLRESWRRVHAGSGSDLPFDTFWREALREGVVRVAAGAGSTPRLRVPDTALTFDAPAFDGEEDGLDLIVYPSSRFYDGRTANRSWLQELPDPVSKIAWQGWVEVNPETAGGLGLRNGDVVRVRSPHGELEVPVWTYPGIREDAVAIQMGGGHEELGRYARGNGVNPVALLPAEAERPSGAFVWAATRVSLEPTGRRIRLAKVQESDSQHDRGIAPAVAMEALASQTGGFAAAAAPGGAGEHAGEAGHAGGGGHAGEAAAAEEGHGAGPVQELQELGGFKPSEPEVEGPGAYPLRGSRYGPYDPEEQPRWAMAIDLDRCTGCSACVTACYAENNVPVVGEDQVLMGREMAWLRIERYYEDVDATGAGPVDVRHLPMLCQHCGNAPCEPVCPVYAAYHTPDGINAQVYNRCVGTRYCANNCPYKVRVFNWYTYTDVPEPLNWQYNPDVTVRENGVMEKCTFCVQRIREKQNQATLESRELRDGEIVPACQQACPTEAIVFGDIRDPEARVSRASGGPRAHTVLEELNTRSAVTYLKKVTFHPVEGSAHG